MFRLILLSSLIAFAANASTYRELDLEHDTLKTLGANYPIILTSYSIANIAKVRTFVHAVIELNSVGNTTLAGCHAYFYNLNDEKVDGIQSGSFKISSPSISFQGEKTEETIIMGEDSARKTKLKLTCDSNLTLSDISTIYLKDGGSELEFHLKEFVPAGQQYNLSGNKQ